MRHIDGVYTQRNNRRHRSDGQLFRGRYKSILVDEKSYLLELVRYIHRNPVKTGLEVPESRTLAPEVNDIILLVCSLYKMNLHELLSSQRGVFNEPRNVAIYLIRRLHQDTLHQIGEHFHIHTYKTVSSILCKMNDLLKHDKYLKRKINTLLTKATSHQEI